MFKRYFFAVENTLLRIPYTAVVFAFLVPFYFMYSNGIAFAVSGNFFENIFCDPFLLRLYTAIGLIILLSGVGVAREDDAIRYTRLKSRNELAAVNIFSAAVASFLYVFIVLLVFTLFFKFVQGQSLANVWSAGIRTAVYGTPNDLYPTPSVRNLFSPLGAVLIKGLYISVYCTFLAVFSMTINVILKQSVGSIICALTVLCASLFGGFNPAVYNLYPWFNGDFKVLTGINGYTYVFYSVIYWVVALTAVSAAYCLVMRKCDLISLSREDRT